MSLGLLAPAALVLGVLAALPVLAHLARQTPRERQAFGAMMLLERLVKRLRRRRRVKDPWLLLARLLAVLMLVLAAAAPTVTYRDGTPEFGGSGRVVLVLDRSASMQMVDQGSTLFARARADAVAVAEALPDSTLAGAVVYDGQAIRLAPSLTGDHADLARRLAEVGATGGTSNLRAALVEARGLLGGEPGEVLLFSDEAGPRMIPDAHSELALLVTGGSAVIPRTVTPSARRNVAVTSAIYGSGIEGGTVTLRVANFGPTATEVACQVILPDGARIPIFVELPPEGEAEERITVPEEALGGVGRVSCQDPDLPVDDERFFHLPRIGASRVLVVDGDPGDTPLRSEVYFLERALAPWGTLEGGFRPDVATPGGAQGLDADTYRVVILANVSDPRPLGPRLVEFVRRGGALLIGVGDNVTAERYNAAFGSILPAPFRRSMALADRAEEGMPLALPRPGHALFEPFARAGRAGFGRVRSHRVMAFEPFEDGAETRTLMEYEGGAPALVERRIGKGRVVVWTSTFDLGWSNLPLQAVYMPFAQRLVTVMGGDTAGSAERIDSVVGAPVSVPLTDLSLEPEVFGPDGEAFRSRIDGSTLRFTPDEPGAYRVGLEDAPPMAWVAVNTDPEESDVRSFHSVTAAQTEVDPDLFKVELQLAGGLWSASGALLILQALLMIRRRSP